MQNNGRNIYQIARNYKGITQEKAAELLAVSVESLRAYEADRTIPPNDVARGMIEVYGTQHLAHQHIMHSSEVARQYLPTINVANLHSGLAHLMKELQDYEDCKKDLINIVCDGRISDDERVRWEEIGKELLDVAGAFMALVYAQPAD